MDNFNEFNCEQAVIACVGQEPESKAAILMLKTLVQSAQPMLVKKALTLGVPISPERDGNVNPVHIGMDCLLASKVDADKRKFADCVVLMLLNTSDKKHYWRVACVSTLKDKLLGYDVKPFLREALLDICGRRFTKIEICQPVQSRFTWARQYAAGLFGTTVKTPFQAQEDLASINSCIGQLETVLDDKNHVLRTIMENKTGWGYSSGEIRSVAMRALDDLLDKLITIRDSINGISADFNPLL